MKTNNDALREALEPCPFCGESSDLTVHVYGNGDDDAYVQCRECTTCGPNGGDRAGAITKWNHRSLAASKPATQAQGEPQPDRVFLERTLAAMEGVLDVADRRTDEFDAMRACVVDLTLMLHKHPQQLAAQAQAQGEPTGCACRWDKDDNRVQTCERHQGWLDVVHEWAERAKSAEAETQSYREALAQHRVALEKMQEALRVAEESVGDLKALEIVRAAITKAERVLKGGGV